MTEPYKPAVEMERLLAVAVDGRLTESDRAQLERLLHESNDARESYVEHVILDAMLRWVHAPPLGAETAEASDASGLLAALMSDAAGEDDLATQSNRRGRAAPAVPPQQGFPAPFATSPSSYATLASPLGSFVFSYLLAAVIVGAGILAGWMYQLSAPQGPVVIQKRMQPPPAGISIEPERVFVGRIAAMEDCRWASSHEAPVGFDRITLGRNFKLTSGLVEIAYDSGARVILQGPCTYNVDSRTGGLLSLGKLTARVEIRGEGGEGKGEGGTDNMAAKSPNLQISQSPNPDSPLSPPPSPLFSIRTPTATIADLGTEFGVEVDKSGGSKTYVYRGKVEVRTIEGDAAKGKVVVIGQGESARVEAGNDRVARVVRGKEEPTYFVRQMPKWIPIKVYGTGVGQQVGVADSHWQIAARSDDPEHRIRPAKVVEPTDPRWMSNRFDRCQWISWGLGDAMFLPLATYTFRTKFDLTGMRPSTAALHGRFAANSHVRAIRLNGRSIHVPPHGRQEFSFLRPFSSDGGFVEGVNVLEIDVENSDALAMPSSSAVGLIVELEGSALTAWPEAK
jgi:hypothetical protein